MSITEWNDSTLKRMGVNARSVSPKVVRSVGDAKRATLPDGTVVERTDLIFVENYGLVRCAPYELHFIYQVPKHILENTSKQSWVWGLMCTCGSIAGVIGYAAYSKLASPTDTGMIIACVRHTTLKQNEGIGRHADESSE